MGKVDCFCVCGADESGDCCECPAVDWWVVPSAAHDGAFLIPKSQRRTSCLVSSFAIQSVLL